jgi:hypothetical protein
MKKVAKLNKNNFKKKTNKKQGNPLTPPEENI